MRFSRFTLIVVLLLSAVKAAGFREHLTLNDFRVYETAATLVREHRGALMYDGADNGKDPQLRWAEPDSVFRKTAESLGLSQVRLYVYPPVLADLLVPVSYLDARSAGIAWTTFNFLLLAATILSASMLLGVRLASWGALAVLVGVATFDPILECLVWGQILIFLLFLWTLGTWFYVRGWKTASAAVFALATAIKLTPLILIFPVILWRDWRWLRAYLSGLAAIFLAVLAVNGRACLEDCFLRVLPAMANGVPLFRNRSLLAACQVIYATLHGADPTSPTPVTMAMPHTLTALVKAANLLCLGAAVWLLVRGRKASDAYTQGLVLSLFGILSVVIAPVSWEHAYSVCLLSLALLWAEALRRALPRAYVVLLALSTLEMNWLLVSYLPRHLSHGLINAVAEFGPVYFALALTLTRLAVLRSFDRLPRAHAAYPIGLITNSASTSMAT